jgi:hypothetical protein
MQTSPCNDGSTAFTSSYCAGHRCLSHFIGNWPTAASSASALNSGESFKRGALAENLIPEFRHLPCRLPELRNANTINAECLHLRWQLRYCMAAWVSDHAITAT